MPLRVSDDVVEDLIDVNRVSHYDPHVLVYRDLHCQPVQLYTSLTQDLPDGLCDVDQLDMGRLLTRFGKGQQFVDKRERL